MLKKLFIIRSVNTYSRIALFVRSNQVSELHILIEKQKFHMNDGLDTGLVLIHLQSILDTVDYSVLFIKLEAICVVGHQCRRLSLICQGGNKDLM